MKKSKLAPFYVVVLALVFFTGCEKNKEEPEQTYMAPEIASQTAIIEAPSELLTSDDPNALMAVSYISMVNAFASMPALFSTLPQDATQGELKSTGSSWTWSDAQGNAIWIEFIESTVEYTWKYYIKSSEMESRILLCKVTELKTGLGGDMEIYEQEQGDLAITYSWTKSTSGTLKETILFSDGTDSFFFEVTVNSDKSGNISIFGGTGTTDPQLADISWNSDGSGSFWIKDASSGQTLNGTF
jgi:hypothetical protein